MRIGIVSLLFFIVAFSQQCLAVDKSIYYGQWEAKTPMGKIALNIQKSNIEVNIDGNRIKQTIEYEYVYSKHSPYPYLSLLFNDKEESEHLIYVTIGTNQENSPIITGFYEVTKIIPDSHGRVESKTVQVDFGVIQK